MSNPANKKNKRQNIHVLRIHTSNGRMMYCGCSTKQNPHIKYSVNMDEKFLASQFRCEECKKLVEKERREIPSTNKVKRIHSHSFDTTRKDDDR